MPIGPTKSPAMSSQPAKSNTNQNRHVSQTHNLRSNIPNQESATASSKITEHTKLGLVKNSASVIKDAESARKWLTKQELVLQGETVTNASIAMALLFLTHGTVVEVQDLIDGMRAAALCMDTGSEGNQDEGAVGAAKEEMQGWMRETRGAVEEMMKKTRDMVEEVKISLTKATEEATEKITVERAEMREAAINLEEIGNRTQTKTYASVAAMRPREERRGQEAKELNDYLIREEIQNRRVILDSLKGVKSTTEGLSPRELVEKANMALKLMEEGGAWDEFTKPMGAEFVSARTLKNGGILFEMDDTDGVSWLREPENRKNFEEKFGGAVKLKARQFQVVIRFVPVCLKESLESAVGPIERANHLNKGIIENIRWLRDPKHWKPDQKAAHAVISIGDIELANAIIRDGLLVESQRLRARKLEEEPKRCFKCQRLNPGHKAAECPSKVDVCPNCAGDHVGSQCSATEGEFSCASCKANGKKHNHTAWDKACASVIAEKAIMRTRNPAMRYKYFPTRESDTQVRIEEEEGAYEAVNHHQEKRRM